MSKNIVFEGWLTKSPPNKRIWRTKWRRRWFALRQSGELPGQYFLDYFADRNCRRLKGTINLDLCEQVDAGLHMERGNGVLAPKDRGSVFTIQTQTRIYHLEADCEADMEKWVDAICRVCGLRATDGSSNIMGPYENNMNNLSAMSEHPYDTPEGTRLYIPISECVTGAREQDMKTFTFDEEDIDRAGLQRVGDSRSNQMYMSHPQIRLNHTDLSENESNISDEDCTSLNASESNIRDWSVAKSFTKLSVNAKRFNGGHHPLPEDGPPVPPRPPKTLGLSKDVYHKEGIYQGPKIQEPTEAQENVSTLTWNNRRAAPPSPLRAVYTRTTDDEEEYSPGHQSFQYCNLGSLPVPAPPAVDRALKPRHSAHNPPVNVYFPNHQPVLAGHQDHALQYLDLDLPMSKPMTSKNRRRRSSKTALGKSLPEVGCEVVYKTVDFVKTEAFNITRQDAEASRNIQH